MVLASPSSLRCNGQKSRGFVCQHIRRPFCVTQPLCLKSATQISDDGYCVWWCFSVQLWPNCWKHEYLAAFIWRQNEHFGNSRNGNYVFCAHAWDGLCSSDEDGPLSVTVCIFQSPPVYILTHDSGIFRDAHVHFICHKDCHPSGSHAYAFAPRLTSWLATEPAMVVFVCLELRTRPYQVMFSCWALVRHQPPVCVDQCTTGLR